MNYNQIALILVDIQNDFWEPYKSCREFDLFHQMWKEFLRKAEIKVLRLFM